MNFYSNTILKIERKKKKLIYMHLVILKCNNKIDK